MLIAIDTIRTHLWVDLFSDQALHDACFLRLLALGVSSAALDGVVLAPSALSRSRSAVELRLRRFLGVLVW